MQDLLLLVKKSRKGLSSVKGSVLMLTNNEKKDITEVIRSFENR